MADLTALLWYFHGQTKRDATKFFKHEGQEIIRNSNPVHPEYQPRIFDYTNLKSDYYEDWDVGYLSMFYQVHNVKYTKATSMLR